LVASGRSGVWSRVISRVIVGGTRPFVALDTRTMTANAAGTVQAAG
jgi:hypothetical protein